MADDAEETAATKASAAVLKKLLDAVAPEPEAPTPTPAAVVDELYGAISGSEISSIADQASAAVERYRSSMRWLVASVAAIGVVVFGSTAFTEVDLWKEWRWVGLLVAAAGLVLVLASAVLMFEPEDASLGELATDFSRVSDEGARTSFYGTRRKSTLELKKIIEGPESYAHIGHDTVNDLITSIDRQLVLRAGGSWPTGQSAPTRTVSAEGPALLVAHLRRVVAADTEMRSFVARSLEELVSHRETLAAKNQPTDELDQQILSLLADDQELRRNSMTALTELHNALRDLQVIDYQLGLDLLHRDLVLSESSVAQLRGKFRLSKKILLYGAVITLVGSLLYVAGIKRSTGASDDDLPIRQATMVVASGSSTADQVRSICLDRELTVLLVAEDRPEPNEAFTVQVSLPKDCEGELEVLANRVDGDVTLDLGNVVEPPDS